MLIIGFIHQAAPAQAPAAPEPGPGRAPAAPEPGMTTPRIIECYLESNFPGRIKVKRAWEVAQRNFLKTEWLKWDLESNFQDRI